jgi:hypothetical protein
MYIIIFQPPTSSVSVDGLLLPSTRVTVPATSILLLTVLTPILLTLSLVLTIRISSSGTSSETLRTP